MQRGHGDDDIDHREGSFVRRSRPPASATIRHPHGRAPAKGVTTSSPQIIAVLLGVPFNSSARTGPVMSSESAARSPSRATSTCVSLGVVHPDRGVGQKTPYLSVDPAVPRDILDLDIPDQGPGAIRRVLPEIGSDGRTALRLETPGRRTRSAFMSSSSSSSVVLMPASRHEVTRVSERSTCGSARPEGGPTRSRSAAADPPRSRRSR